MPTTQSKVKGYQYQSLVNNITPYFFHDPFAMVSKLQDYYFNFLEVYQTQFFFIVYFIDLHFKYYPLPGFPSRNALPYIPLPCFYEGTPSMTYPLLPHYTSIPQHQGIEPPQDQGPPLPLMPDKAILCYICGWSHWSLHVYSFVGGLVPGSPLKPTLSNPQTLTPAFL